MNTTDNVINRVERLARGYVFTYDEFITDVNNREAVIKALNRLVKKEKIRKLSKGRFYKPEITAFGELEPNEYQVAKDLLEKNGKTIGYISGYSIYNKLGLSTQMSHIIQIGRNEIRPPISRGNYKIFFIKQKNHITKENIPLLQILDAIRFIQKIPDASMAFLYKRFLAIIYELSDNDISKTVRLSLKYPPATRALLGAFLSELDKEVLTESLSKSLNPITIYKSTGINEFLLYADKWNIK
ncbi:MAG: hypothetical protein B7C24_05870 [Bacteroidetes bacterium 4572_77]|nr:MAG: hypothetical protein B7C24_05870 [Bacteroidetes bacterium 4572_77]